MDPHKRKRTHEDDTHINRPQEGYIERSILFNRVLQHPRINSNDGGPIIHSDINDVTAGKPRPGVRIQVVETSPPNKNPLASQFNSAQPWQASQGQAPRYSGPAAPQQQRPSNPPARPQTPSPEEMGNQVMRQHVETSAKTGVFHLSKAKLHEFPPELAKIVGNLRNVDLSSNRISAIPQNIAAFTNLKSLNLSSNQIEVIPDQIGQLARLETLNLSNNRIKTVPDTVAQLQSLRNANLNSNVLIAFPVAFSNLKLLSVLDLSKNRIPEVPDGVSGLQVVELILNQNQIRKVSKDLACCPQLKTLRLQGNRLEVSGLPIEIWKDSQVSLISLEGNLFDMKQLSSLEGYEAYMDRYTSTKRKLT